MKLIFTLITIAFITCNGFTQNNLVNNPSFEYANPNSPTAPNNYNGSIEYAANWYNLNNSCDWGSNNSTVQAYPHTGSKNGRFGMASNGSEEYFYGSTLSLTAGKIYTISFWVRQDQSSNNKKPVGLYISSNQPTKYNLNPFQVNIPQLTCIPTSTTYIQATTCFTPTTTGIHYITIGNFVVGDGTPYLFAVDDVSVVENNGPFAVSNLTIQNSIVCTGSNVIIDGTSSVNETEYKWDIYEVVAGIETLKVQGVKQSGQASTFNATQALAGVGITPIEGSCYKVYLTTYNGCSNTKSINFCYQKLDLKFLNNTLPICSLNNLTLSVTGDNNWIYSWSTNQSGVGLKSINVNSPIKVSQFSVTATSTLGCKRTESINFVVHSGNNTAPTMDGINSTGVFSEYAKSKWFIDFYSYLSNDNANEKVTFTSTVSSLPNSIYTLIDPTLNNGKMQFTWDLGKTGPNVNPGVYNFNVNVKDNNACLFKENNYTFTIYVTCDYSPLSIDYENRTSQNNPLPTTTKASKFIQAGINQTVNTGSNEVVFQAGQNIQLGPNFEAGPGFTAQIDPLTNVTNCEACCTNWEGFTLDPIQPNLLIFNDPNPTNRIFQIMDTKHPFCAFNALGYSFEIKDRTGVVYYSSKFNADLSSSSCCQLKSPSQENPIIHSSIWWDGTSKDMFGRTYQVNKDTYYSVLTLYGCNGTSKTYQYTFDVRYYTSGLMIQNEDIKVEENLETLNLDQLKNSELAVNKIDFQNNTISITPNPASESVEINGIDKNKDIYIQIYDEKGIIVKNLFKLENKDLNISYLKTGIYFFNIYVDGKLTSKKIEKL